MAERTAASRRSPDIAFQSGGSHKITRVLKNHWKLAASGVAAVGVLSMPPSQFINKIDALGAAMGIGSISCVEGVQPAHPGYSADEIVLLGSGNHRDRKLRTYAAVDDLIAGTAPVLFVDDGTKDGLRGQLVQIKEIYHRKTHRDLPISALVFVGNAADTAGNMHILARTVATRGDKVVAIVTNAGHENRATMDGCQDGVPSFPLPAERTLHAYDPEIFRNTDKKRFGNIYKFVSLLGERIGLVKSAIIPGSG